MSTIALAFAFLHRRWGQALLSMLVGALGIAAVATAVLSAEALPKAAEQAWGGVDLVIGPKSSALDLVLCCALHVSDPSGLVSHKAAMAVERNPWVRVAAPIALGDNVRGWRIAGTTPALLSVYRADLSQGRVWAKPLEAVLGAAVARATGLKVGDSFVGAHGLAEGGEMHQKHEEEEAAERGISGPHINLPDAATAVVVSYRTPAAAVLLPRLINADPQLTAASPTFEIARTMSYLRPLITVAEALGGLLVLIAAAGAATALMATMNARTRDLALLRALGAGPWRLAGVAFAEAGMIGVAATVLGLLLTVALFAVGGQVLAAQTGLLLTPDVSAWDVAVVVAGAFGVACVAALIPAIRAARTPIEELLQA